MVAGGYLRDGLHRIWVLPKFAVTHYAAVMVTVILSAGVVLAAAVVRSDACIGEKAVAFVHIRPEIVVGLEGVALHQRTRRIFLEIGAVTGEKQDKGRNSAYDELAIECISHMVSLLYMLMSE